MYEKILNKVVFLIVTVFGLGKIKYAPGTFGSLAAYPIIYISVNFIINNDFYLDNILTNIQFVISMFTVSLSFIILIFIIGTIASHFYMKNHSANDPQEIVIDELVGQLLTVLISLMTIPSILNLNISTLNIYYFIVIIYGILPFFLFRLYDIIKPWPINWLDQNIKGAIGVMIDDVGAAIMAGITHCALVFVLLDILQ